jgi:hypothetical protein
MITNPNLNKNRPQAPFWLSRRGGSSSPMLKRLFVTGLAAVALAVWTVTVISVRVLRNEGRGGAQTAHAAPAPVTPRPMPLVADRPSGEDEFADFGPESPDAVADSAAGTVIPELTINLPDRNPFTPLPAYFPAPKPKDAPKTGRETAGQVAKAGNDNAATAAETAAREFSFVETLKIRGTLVKGGRTLVIIDDGVYCEGDTIGDRLTVGEIGHKASASRGRELPRQFVVLKGSVREYVVEIKP